MQWLVSFHETVVIEVPNDKAEKIHDKFRDTIFSIHEGEASTRFILYVPDEMAMI